LASISNIDFPPDIRSLTNEELTRALASVDEKKFRVQQIYQWIWKLGSTTFDDMLNIPGPTREFLKTHFSFHSAKAEIQQKGSDGTVKTGFRLYDGSVIEGVLIPAGGRFTACISSQVGCNLGCKFCATGRLGFTRNLTTGEIFDQVVYLSRLAGTIQRSEPESRAGSVVSHPEPGIGRLLSNIVYMGMGEPFLNYEAVKKSIETITSAESLGMSPQRITVSSIGIPKMIRTMADDRPKYHFALSLHAANDKKRSRIIPFNLHHPLPEIIEALKYYHTKTGKRITIEYILFAGVNDSPADASELALFCRNFPVKINLIEYNAVNETGLSGSGQEAILSFVTFLERRNLVVNVRKSRGKDIQAACGQLSANYKNVNK